MCSRTFKSNLTRNRHEESCTGHPHECRICNAVLCSLRNLNNHQARCIRKKHEDARNEHCEREAALQVRLEEQQRSHLHRSVTEEGCYQHQEEEEAEAEAQGSSDKYQCVLCPQTFTNIKQFRDHRQSHYDRKKKKKSVCICHTCKKHCQSRAELTDHLREAHNVDNDLNAPKLKCSDCNECFDTHYQLHAHRMKQRHGNPTPHPRSIRLDDKTVKMPWETDPGVKPPWTWIDAQGIPRTDYEFMHVYNENRDTILAPHDPGVVRGIYNFPVADYVGETSIMRPHLEQILQFETSAFKINAAFGLILRHVETGEYRYFTAYYNNTVLDVPFRVSRASDINPLLKELEHNTSIDSVMKKRESTKWEKVYITNVAYFIYRTGYAIGHPPRMRPGRILPEYISQSHVIVTLDANQHDRTPYNDHLCAFRCLAWSVGGRNGLERRTSGYYHSWRNYQIEQGVTDLPVDSRRFKGVQFKDLPDFEECFERRVFVYSLSEDKSCVSVYQSMRPSDDIGYIDLYLNLFEHHFSLITDFEGYARKFACRFCQRAFDRAYNLKRHEPLCCNRVKYKLPGGIFSPPLTIFEELEQTIGVVVDPSLRYYPWFAVFDFESVLKPKTPTPLQPRATEGQAPAGEENNGLISEDDEYEADDQQPQHQQQRDEEEQEEEQEQEQDEGVRCTPRTEWTATHMPVCVSVSSNVEGFTHPRCIIDDDADNLVKLMCDYLSGIQAAAAAKAQERWQTVLDSIEEVKAEFPVAPLDDLDPRTRAPVQTDEELHHQTECPSDIAGMDYVNAREIHAKRCESLHGRFKKYISVMPVLGFNSSKYDLNLIKQYFPKHLNLATDCDYVIKKTNQYTAIATSKFKFLDIVNYLAAGCSYSKFLKAYDVEESKSYFPYEWFDDVGKLDYPALPPYESFYSRLKNANVLDVEHSEWREDGSVGVPPADGRAKYQELLRIWHDKGMTKFEHFVEHYANLDTGPFVQAAEKLQKYYFDMEVDVFKVAISAPGVARRLLFEHARSNNRYFASFSPEHEDLYHKLKKCAFGGPSIIFKRYAKVGETLIRDNPEKECKSIAGYDCNGLYLWAIGEALPVLFPIRRLEETNFKPEVSWRHLEMYIWMNWRMTQDGVHIQHKMNSGKEFPVGPFRLDGYAAGDVATGETPRGYEFHGCWTHGHDPALCGFNRDSYGNVKFNVTEKSRLEQAKKRKDTEERERYIRARRIDLTVIYECEFAALKKDDPSVNALSAHMFPEFYLSYPRQVSTETLLRHVESGLLTGFLQVDIRVPEQWPPGKERDVSPQEYFSEMSPIFCNSEVHFNDWGETMQNYSLSRQAGQMTNSRKLLVGGMAADKIFLATNLLKWYLERGLEVTRVYDVVEYRFEKCFEGFCDFISDARREGDRDSSKEILGETCKVLGNSSYGSLLLDKTKHSNVKYVHHCHQVHLAVNDPQFKSACDLPGDMYEIEMSKKTVSLDIPVQLAFATLQSAKLKLLEFYYDCLDHYIDRSDFEITHADTDSIYFTTSGATLEDVVKPAKLEEFKHALYGHCYDRDSSGEPFRASDTNWFPRRCCHTHAKHDKRERGLFKLEASGVELIALASKTYYLKREDAADSVKAKGINKRALIEPRGLYMSALRDRQTGSATNVGFRAVDNTIKTYSQTRTGFNFFYAKRKVLEDGITTVPLSITLNPWEEYNVVVLRADKNCLSNDYQCAMRKHGHLFRSCTQLFSYELCIYNDAPAAAVDVLKSKNNKKIHSLVRAISPKHSWYTARDDVMSEILWQKINTVRHRVILELRECRGRLVVHPGWDSYFTCGLSQKMAEITKPAQFPGMDMMSVFWEERLADLRFMES